MSYEVESYWCENRRKWVAHIVDDEGEGPQGEADNKISALVDLGANMETVKHDLERFVAVLDAIRKARAAEQELDGRNASYRTGYAHAMGDVMGII